MRASGEEQAAAFARSGRGRRPPAPTCSGAAAADAAVLEIVETTPSSIGASSRRTPRAAWPLRPRPRSPRESPSGRRRCSYRRPAPAMFCPATSPSCSRFLVLRRTRLPRRGSGSSTTCPRRRRQALVRSSASTASLLDGEAGLPGNSTPARGRVPDARRGGDDARTRVSTLLPPCRGLYPLDRRARERSPPEPGGSSPTW